MHANDTLANIALTAKINEGPEEDMDDITFDDFNADDNDIDEVKLNAECFSF